MEMEVRTETHQLIVKYKGKKIVNRILDILETALEPVGAKNPGDVCYLIKSGSKITTTLVPDEEETEIFFYKGSFYELINIS
jgi:hypothetical protein